VKKGQTKQHNDKMNSVTKLLTPAREDDNKQNKGGKGISFSTLSNLFSMLTVAAPKNISH
jgi:hypothetical protein